MTEIFLEGLEFYARHGVYEAEQSLGNRFQVDIRLEADLKEAGDSDDLIHTIDYVMVYALISKLMQEKFKLLEALGTQIIGELVDKFPRIQNIEVTVSKFNPPISGLCKRVAVTSRWNSEG